MKNPKIWFSKTVISVIVITVIVLIKVCLAEHKTTS